MLKARVLWGAVCLLALNQIQAEMYADIALTNGYRNDSFSSSIDVFIPPPDLVFFDDLKVDNLSIYQLGLRAHAAVGNCFVRAEGDYGWGGSGKYTDLAALPDGSFPSLLEGKSSKGRVYDFSIGGGILFPTFTCISVGPVAGWSYDQQGVTIDNFTDNGLPASEFNGLEYRNWWQGPWVGLDVSFRTSALILNLGYEYHFGNWRAKWLLPGADIVKEAYSDERKAKHVSGNLFYVDGRYSIDCNWSMGLGFKYQNWHAWNGVENPIAGSFASIGLPSDEEDRVRKAKWRSYAVTIDVSYDF